MIATRRFIASIFAPQPFLQRELYLSAMTINGINSDPFCVYSADNARVKAFKLMAEF
ncbi:hypothetical protein EcSMS35_2056 [Escherichia coli SMS-3-5]|uniref:Uncharacterized protein n=1 Tax=Escherichia coli (strain SMS-3-5 / SECEC) TaxID=439855 RepID=B1LI74_ECOSM|nr:hypothetical protein EcSMS35_2056 [Escherichia coli SMS-3-5]KEJ14286.1 hypothetical protein AD07_1242 [Escherichia coli 8-415-05_S4_C2]KEJ34326.1 hypothetical protein AD36_1246 [Escherichia coli 8-415-05_S4_C3]KEN43360.1 hypothetical protein AB96_1237 [Escherichia coli 8-415-05_S3_C1]CCQ04735.1 FIG01069320: hypothetical protein [Escherichia coli Nissle 1917]